jgi:hypothetical protein
MTVGLQSGCQPTTSITLSITEEKASGEAAFAQKDAVRANRSFVATGVYVFDAGY